MLSLQCMSPVTGRHQAWPEISVLFLNRPGEEAMATIPPNQRSERRFCAAITSARVWLPALAAFAFATASWAEDTRKGASRRRKSKPSYNIAKFAMAFRRKVSVAITRYHASPDSNPHMWKISCRLSLSVDEQTTSCSTSHIR